MASHAAPVVCKDFGLPKWFRKETYDAHWVYGPERRGVGAGLVLVGLGLPALAKCLPSSVRWKSRLSIK